MAQDGRCRVLYYSVILGDYGCDCIGGVPDIKDFTDAQMEDLVALSCMGDEAEVLQIELYMKLLQEAQRTGKKIKYVRKKIGRR